MNDSVFEAVEKSSRILRLGFSSIEFAKLAEEQDFSETPKYLTYQSGLLAISFWLGLAVSACL